MSKINVPMTVPTLDLSHQQFDDLTPDEFANILNKLSPAMKQIKLAGNNLFSLSMNLKTFNEFKNKVTNKNHLTQVFLAMLNERASLCMPKNDLKNAMSNFCRYAEQQLLNEKDVSSIQTAADATLELLRNRMTRGNYELLAATFEGAPSVGLQALGVIMLAISAAAIVALACCPPALVIAGGGLTGAGYAVGALGIFSAFASPTFFVKGCESSGLSKRVTDISEAAEPYHVAPQA